MRRGSGVFVINTMQLRPPTFLRHDIASQLSHDRAIYLKTYCMKDLSFALKHHCRRRLTQPANPVGSEAKPTLEDKMVNCVFEALFSKNALSKEFACGYATLLRSRQLPDHLRPFRQALDYIELSTSTLAR